MLPGSQLGPTARSQLAAWETIAGTWRTAPDGAGDVLLCARCQKGIMLIRDTHGRPYSYTDDQRLAQMVLHLRNHHPELDPDKP